MRIACGYWINELGLSYVITHCKALKELQIDEPVQWDEDSFFNNMPSLRKVVIEGQRMYRYHFNNYKCEEIPFLEKVFLVLKIIAFLTAILCVLYILIKATLNQFMASLNHTKWLLDKYFF